MFIARKPHPTGIKLYCPSSMCARVQTDVVRCLRVLRVPVFQFCTCLWRHVLGVLGVLCVFLGPCVLCSLCALYAFSKPHVQHRLPQKRTSGQKRTDGRQRNIYIYIYSPPMTVMDYCSEKTF